LQQTTLTDDTTTDEPTTTTASTTDRESSTNARTMLAPPVQRGGDRCCPWCLAASETFEHHGDGARCGYCDASIPLGADWFERGEKITV
jgi:hypothetical protein